MGSPSRRQHDPLSIAVGERTGILGGRHKGTAAYLNTTAPLAAGLLTLSPWDADAAPTRETSARKRKPATRPFSSAWITSCMSPTELKPAAGSGSGAPAVFHRCAFRGCSPGWGWGCLILYGLVARSSPGIIFLFWLCLFPHTLCCRMLRAVRRLGGEVGGELVCRPSWWRNLNISWSPLGLCLAAFLPNLCLITPASLNPLGHSHAVPERGWGGGDCALQPLRATSCAHTQKHGLHFWEGLQGIAVLNIHLVSEKFFLC